MIVLSIILNNSYNLPEYCAAFLGCAGAPFQMRKAGHIKKSSDGINIAPGVKNIRAAKNCFLKSCILKLSGV